MLDEAALGDEALRLCQALLRVDTTNPPGNERPAAGLLATELASAGLDPTVLDSAPGRGNVVARLRGTGAKPPLLLSAHLDVVEADAPTWTHPPFAGEIADGFLWGRGAIDVIPGLAECEIDGRTLPGQTTEDLLRELGAILGPDVELEVMRQAPPLVTEPARSPLFDTIAEVVAARDPGAIAVPYLTPGFTDGKCFARLGVKWYRFTPVKLPRGLRFADLYHGTDERIPTDGLRWGAAALADVVLRFAGAA